jgi:hypothetical protein
MGHRFTITSTIMNRKLLLAALSAILFYYLFHGHSPGLNVLLYELFLMGGLFVCGLINPKKRTSLLLLAAVTGSALAFVWHNTPLSFCVNLLLFVILCGHTIYSESRSGITSLALGIHNLVGGPKAFLAQVLESNSRHMKPVHLVYRNRFTVVPLMVILLFTLMYQFTNPYFSEALSKMMQALGDTLETLIHMLSFKAIPSLLLGTFLAIWLFFPREAAKLIRYDKKGNDHLLRERKTGFYFPAMGLRTEYKAGVFLLAGLNLVLFLLNTTEIYWVWFNFKWDGQYLKHFVHEGTWILIFSLFLSMAVVFWLFRGNLNFYSGNRWLLWLGRAWILQNILLLISVAIRNYWYIHYFALAYKRLGVFLFLLFALSGLITALIKINRRKTFFYLIRVNFNTTILILFLFALVNWPVVIAKYNFSHYRQSFVHLDFLANLPDKALPWLMKNETEMKEIAAAQSKLFRFEEDYMSPDHYRLRITDRCEKFKLQWSRQSWQSWNYAEAKAYKLLSQSAQ